MSHYYAGIDIGSTMTKVVILGDRVLTAVIGPTGPEHRRLANRVMEEALRKAGVPFQSVVYIVSTGYGRINVPFADRQFTEISCQAKAVSTLFPRARTIVDIGGQDTKAIKIDEKGRIHDFVMNDKCAAGTGRFIEVMADTLEIALDRVGVLSLQSSNPAKISSICTIWAQQEVTAGLAEGIPVSDLIAGLLQSLAERIATMVNRLKIEDEVVLTGGGAKNEGLVKFLSERLCRKLVLPEEPLITGALGAGLLAKDIFEQAAAKGLKLEAKKRVLEEVEVLA